MGPSVDEGAGTGTVRDGPAICACGRGRARSTVAGMRFPQDVPVLGDGRVTLRAHSMDDVDAVTEQGQDPEMTAWTTVPHPYRRDDAVEWVGTRVPAGWADGSNLGFAIVHGRGYAGSVDLRPHSDVEAEVGFALHPAQRGQGVMRHALNL